MKLRKVEKQDNDYLLRKFNELNRLYFEGKCKVDAVCFGSMLLDPILGKTTFGYFTCDIMGKARSIMVNKHLNKYSLQVTMPWASELVLHHEMCHAYLADMEEGNTVEAGCSGMDQHGPEFQALMKKHPLHEKAEAVETATEEILSDSSEALKRYLASRETLKIKKEHLIASEIPSALYIMAPDVLADLLRGKEVKTKDLMDYLYPTPEQVAEQLKKLAEMTAKQ